DAEIGAICHKRRAERIALPLVLCEGRRRNATLGYDLARSSRATSQIRSGSKPNLICSSLSGADAPNVFIPIIRPELPTYRSHPKVDACSIEIRAVTFAGSTLSRYSFGW